MAKKEELKKNNLMSIWDAVETSSSSQLTDVNIGRRFKSIDAYSQIKEATQLFGPMGLGWGYEPIYEEHFGMLRCQLKMWAIHNEQRIEWYTEGGCNIEIANDDTVKSIRRAAMSNSDIFKKATTDALTKGLSMLGFNADVFMGLWDDNKYVAEVKRVEQEERNELLGMAGEAPLKSVPNSAPVTITAAQVKALVKLATSVGTPIATILSFTKTESIEDIDPIGLAAVTKKLQNKKEAASILTVVEV